VVLEQLRRMHAVVGKIEPAVDGGWLVVPRARDRVRRAFGDAEIREPAIVDDPLTGLEAQPLDLVRRRLDLVHLAAAERVIRALVPVDRALGVVVDEALALDDLFPAGPRSDDAALHYSPPLECPAAVDPNPPRTTLWTAAPLPPIGTLSNGADP